MDERQEPHLDPQSSLNTPGTEDAIQVETSSTRETCASETGKQNEAPRAPHPGQNRRGMASVLRDNWNGPRRSMMILLGIAFLVLLVGLIDVLTSGRHKAPAPTDQAPAVPQHAGMAGGAAPLPYQKAAHAENAEQAQRAAQHGGSYIPPMGPLQNYRLPPVAPAVSAPPPAQPVVQRPIGPAYGAYPYQTAMDKEIRGITKGLVPVAAQTENSTAKLPGQVVPATATAATASTSSASKPQPVVLAEPGHISFAVLDTSIKSTEPGPVMATIEDGRFAGAKLLGGYVRHAGRVVVEFNEMTLNHQSYPIQAVAITTATARTALSTYTNYHVLYRYGWLIGSALLEGVTNALQYANTNSYITGSGVGVVTQSLSNGQIAASAVGNVGEVLAPIMEKRFETPPTVHVRSGTGVGILFMKPVEQGVAG